MQAPESLDAALYRGPDQYAVERQRIFGRSWLLFCHESQLSGGGSYVASTIAGFPLIVVKGEDGTPPRLSQCLPPPGRAPGR